MKGHSTGPVVREGGEGRGKRGEGERGEGRDEREGRGGERAGEERN